MKHLNNFTIFVVVTLTFDRKSIISVTFERVWIVVTVKIYGISNFFFYIIDIDYIYYFDYIFFFNYRRHMMEEREAQRQMATKMMQSMMDDRDGGVRLGALQGLQAWSPAAMSPGASGPVVVGASAVAAQPPPGHFSLSQPPVASPMC